MKLNYLLSIGGAGILAVGIYVLSTNPVELNSIKIVKQTPQNSDHTVLPVTLSTSHQPNAAIQDTLIALRRDIDSLKKELVTIKTDKQFALQMTRLSSEQETNEPKPKLTKEDVLAQQQQIQQMEEERVKKQNQEFETEFQQQATNRAWSAKTEQMIKDALMDSNFSRADIVDLKCRSSKCRVELLTGDSEQIQNNLMVFPSKIAGELPNINLNQTNGRTTIIYLSQNDTPPPIQTIGPLTQLP